eukprot:6183493-Pleurochrysis_carterae.AAC.7
MSSLLSISTELQVEMHRDAREMCPRCVRDVIEIQLRHSQSPRSGEKPHPAFAQALSLFSTDERLELAASSREGRSCSDYALAHGLL